MLSNPNHKSTAEEEKFVKSIIEGTVIDVDYNEIISDDEDEDETLK
jgi:hypothetical protein